MRNYRTLTFLPMLVLFLLTACGRNAGNEYVWRADITHDGREEKIKVDVADALVDSQQPAHIRVYNGNNKMIWEEELFVPHAGWGSYYLTQYDGEDYLLYYLPELAQGQGIFEYSLFWLDEQGNSQEAASDSISFETYSPEGTVSLPKEEMLAFGEDVNQYLAKGILLVSTVDSELRYSTLENPIVDEEQYERLLKGSGVEISDSAAENLELFEKERVMK